MELMKYLLAQPANMRFQWELEVVITNILSLDSEARIVVLFLEESVHSPAVIKFFREKYPMLEVHSYNDDRTRINYPPTVRPYLVWRYLSEDKAREEGAYFQIDSDIIFRKLPDFSKMPLDSKVCWCSDCSSYIGYDYLISRQQGPFIVDKFSEILSIPVEKIRATPGGGAQWLMVKPTAQMWYHIWQDSQILYDIIITIKSDLQKWTAEMWAELFNLVKFGWEIRLSPELDFCRPTDPLVKWYQTKILHNAGVTEPLARTLFFKGKYDHRTPFGDNLSYVERKKASWMYARAISRVYNTNNV